MALWIQQLLGRLHREEEGQALVEYALILALVAVVVIVVLTALGHHVSNVLNSVNSNLTG